MIDFFKRIISFFLSGFNVNALNKSLNSSVNSDVNNGILSGRDTKSFILNNNGNLNVNVPIEMLYDIHKSNLKGIADDLLNEFKTLYEINDLSLQRLLSRYNNYKAFCLVVNQVATNNMNDKDRRMLLIKLLSDKFKEEDCEVEVYSQAIKIMEDLSVRDIKILSVMTFIMTLSRYLRDETIIVKSSHIINLINDIAIVSEDEVANLNGLRVIYNLFPHQFDDSCLTRLYDFVPDLYAHCSLWLVNNPIVCNYKVTSLGKVLAKTLFSVNYDLNYENFVEEELPLKECDINVKNIHASGNIISQGGVAAGGTISMGSLN